MKMKAAMFDLDGTLVDSMWVWGSLLIDLLAQYQLVPSPEVAENVTHMSLKQSSDYVQKEYQLPLTAEQIHAHWLDEVYQAYKERIALKPGAREYLALLKQQKVKLGLVTACDRKLCDACLKNNGIAHVFDTVTYVDEVGKGKDSPDIYLKCLERLEAKPQDAVLFEDILTGVRTAKKIGLRVVAVEEKDKAEVEALKQEADLYIHDFYDLLKIT